MFSAKKNRNITGLIPIVPLLKVNLLVVFLCIGISMHAQSSEIRPFENRITIAAVNQPFGNVVGNLMENYSVRIGFEESLQDSEYNDLDFDVNLPTSGIHTYSNPFGTGHVTVEARRHFSAKKKSFSLSVQDSTLKKVVDDIVSQMGDYSWEESLGVINIFPKKNRDSRIKDLMELRIKEFDVTKEFSRRNLAEKLTRLPEVKDFLTKNQLHWRSSQVGSTIRLHAQYERPLGKDLAFRDITFRDLLNKLSVAKGGGWKVRNSHLFGSKTKEFIEIDI